MKITFLVKTRNSEIELKLSTDRVWPRLQAFAQGGVMLALSIWEIYAMSPEVAMTIPV